ncbi:MAG: TA system VapC family ribonuclease toxin [Acidimicrobiales bacterium]
MLVDANLLIFAYDETSPFHDRAHAWLEQQLSGARRVGIPWPSALAFLRLTTNPRVATRPLTAGRAWAVVESWFTSPSAWVPTPATRHREILGGLVTKLHLTANLIPDAHLAALAIEHGLELCSADSDFARFPDLRWRNPLVAA